MSEATLSEGLTTALAKRSATLDYDNLPSDVVELARQALLDWFGVTLAGSHEEAPLMLLDALVPASAAPRDPRAVAVSVVGHPLQLPARDASLINGAASHVLDFDDVNLTFPGHASVAVVAALLALAEQKDASSRETIVAFVAGYETACRVAIAIGPAPYRRGFHTTGTIGTFGAAAACARLLGLDPARTAVALGIASSEAAGLKCNFGTMTKSLHAGKACESGLLAAELAARGFTANTSAVEGQQGFAAVSGGNCDVEAALADPPESWHLRGNLFKYHATCFFTHSAIEGVLELAGAHRIDAERIRRIVLHVGAMELGACAIPAPETGLEVKFSITHLTAMALLGRDTAVIANADATDATVIALRRRVELETDGVPDAPTRVEIELEDGTVLAAAHDVNTPERELAAQRARLEDKFRKLADPVLGIERAGELLALLDRVEETSVRALMSAARG